MSTITVSILLGLAAVIIITLAIYASRLLWRLKQQTREAHKREQQRSENQDAMRQKQQEQIIYVNESLRIIAQSLLSDQIEVCEASVRICGLLPFISVNEEHAAALSVFHKVNQCIAHIPQKEAFNALDKKQRKAYRKEIESLENEHKPHAKTAAKTLLLISLATPAWSQLS